MSAITFIRPSLSYYGALDTLDMTPPQPEPGKSVLPRNILHYISFCMGLSQPNIFLETDHRTPFNGPYLGTFCERFEDVVPSSTHYTGYLPYTDPYYNPPPERIIRKIPGNGPVTDLSLIDVQCNGYSDGGVIGSAPAPLFATVAAGSQVNLNWTTWPDSHIGPMITYLAQAPRDITQWSPGNGAVWFKIAEAGKTTDGKWAATDILTANDSIYTFTIPKNLKAGQYIVRHEIIALHAAWTYPGAQVYPSCIQIQVTGSGTAFPTSGLVSFPGAYTATTPGIVYDAYQNTSAYPIPGPAVWTGGN